MQNRLCLLLLFLFTTQRLPLRAQQNEGADYDPNHLYSASELQSDFEVFRYILERVHPGLYWYTPKERLKQEMDSISNLFTKPMTEAEFYKMLTPIVAAIHCGHTVLDPSLLYQDKGKRFPLDLKFINRKAYIFYNYSEDKSIPIGAEVTAINGQAMLSVIAQLLPYLPADALNDQAKYQSLEEDFANYYDLLIGKPEVFELDCIDLKTNQNLYLKIPAMDDDFLREYGKRYAEELQTQKMLEYQSLDSLKTGVLTIRSFLPLDIKTTKQKFSKFIQKVFKQIKNKKTESLIIDLRQNSGGEMLYANELFSYLAKDSYRFLDKVEVTSNKKLTELRLTEISKIAVHNPKRVAEGDSGVYLVKENYYKFLAVQQPKKSGFKGNVYVLIGKKTFSAATLFSILAYSEKRGLLIGEETGGGAKGLNGGDFIDIALPITGLQLEVPVEKWVKIIPRYAYPNRGVIPHHLIQNSIEDELNNQDKVLQFTLDLIRKQ
jgi:hypothetical protein